MSIDITYGHPFQHRHNGPDEDETGKMLRAINASDMEQLISETVPSEIRLSEELNLPTALNEHEFLASFSKLMKKNKVFKSYIGLGYDNWD